MEVKRFCNELDIEYLLELPETTQQEIFYVCDKLKDKYLLAKFFHDFLKLKERKYIKETISFSFRLDTEIFNVQKYHVLKLEQRLKDTKSQLDVLYENKKYSSFVNIFDQFKMLIRMNKKQNLFNTPPNTFTNAWLKCWEMINNYNLLPDKDLTVFCNAEFPGAFIFAINHYIKTKIKKSYQWYANSLWQGDKKGILGDQFSLYRKYRDNWLMNDKINGDVTNHSIRHYIKRKLKDKVDLYTSDIGVALDISTYNLQEEIQTPLNLGQIICGLNTLKNGGHMICKMFMYFKPFNISLLYLLKSVFKELYICKPMSSRPANSEVYIIGKYYEKNQDVIDRLEHILSNWNESYLSTFFVPVSTDHYLRTCYSLYYIFQRQIDTINKDIELFHKNKGFNSFEDILMREDTDETKQELEDRINVVDMWLKAFPIDKINYRHQL